MVNTPETPLVPNAAALSVISENVRERETFRFVCLCSLLIGICHTP